MAISHSVLLLIAVQCTSAIVQFFSPEELRYTFGTTSLRQVPAHSTIWPSWSERPDGFLQLNVTVNSRNYSLVLEPVSDQLHHKETTVVMRKNVTEGSRLQIGLNASDCHYRYVSPELLASISTCDSRIKGLVIDDRGIHVIHPFPDKHAHRIKRSAGSEDTGVHIVYKRETAAAQKDFCGIDNLITEEQLLEDETAIFEDVFVTGQRLVQQSDLVVELAVFIDEDLWRHFSSKYGGAASSKLKDYTLTLLNNIQIMYYQPTASPPLTFRVIRYEVLSAQPSAIAPHLHSYGHAQLYLDRFCRYQRNLGVRDWDHALLLTGFDIHRGSGSTSISGIARLDGMCDPWNTCTLAEGLDFTSAFIGTHELGHSLGMRHDEPYCESRHIMSSSLGPGKVTWSTCSLRDYHSFLQKLDARGKNCMRVSNMPERMHIPVETKPGQMYDANMQCALMHGTSYVQVSPRQDSYDGICHMMWCGQSTFGRIITSHPALEGTFCGVGKWCQLGRCVTWSANDGGETWRPTQPPPTRINGGWSSWPAAQCSYCTCSNIMGGIGLALQRRSCTNPAPANGGSECTGSNVRGLVCDRSCGGQSETVDQFITRKCAEHKLYKNDGDLTGTGSQLTRYPQRACKVFCDVLTRRGTQRNYRFYGDNLPDGTSCGYDRYCLEGECLPLSCSERAVIGRDLSCPVDWCPHSPPWSQSITEPPTTTSWYGSWTAWSQWSACSVTCGGGYRRRSRSCSSYGLCQGDTQETGTCGTQSCPSVAYAPPSWGDWTDWNQCSVSCGHGSQARYRRCRTSAGTLSFDCAGEQSGGRRLASSYFGYHTTIYKEKNIEVRQCDMGSCSAVGLWGLWSVWSSCSTSCGPGTMLRQRTCNREPCDGSSTQRRSCNQAACRSSQGSWTEWNEWSQCSRMCGRGLRTRKRACYEGYCSGSGNEQEYCNEQSCQSSGGDWAPWSGWSSCSVTCGAGVRRRTRYCRQGDCMGSSRESAICNEGDCRDSNAAWGGWGYWSSCSETCGAGIRKRVRKCYGSGACDGSEYEREYCYTRQCF